MEYKFKWDNFKSIFEMCDFELKPITLIIGKNGSGKSSLAQPLLMMKQTIDDADLNIPLMGNGKLLSSGSYKDYIRDHDTEKNLKFDIFVKNKDIPNKKKSKKSKYSNLPPERVLLEFSYDQISKDGILKKLVVYNKEEEILVRERDGYGNYSLKLFQKDILKEDIDSDIGLSIKENKPINFLFNEDHIIRMLFDDMTKNGLPKSDENPTPLSIPSDYSFYLSVMSYINRIFKEFVSNLHYIGPLREAPKRYYSYNGEICMGVGSRGENTYSILNYLNEDEAAMESVNAWLQEFELAREVKWKQIDNRIGLGEIVFKSLRRDIEVNFSDTCFGISQLLPLIVQAYSCDENEFIHTEQPEIHLNPKCEAKLADFFVEVNKTKKVNFIIESHSEHLFMRLRTHVKQGNISNDDIAIYFIDESSEGSFSRRIELDEIGNFNHEEWPKGFFEDALIESLKFATASRL